MGLALVVFLTAIAYLPGIASAATAPRWAVLSIGMTALLCGVARCRMSPAHYLGLAFMLYAWATIAWSDQPLSSIGYAWQLTALAAAFVVAAEIPDVAWGRVWDALAIGVSLSAPVAIAQVFGWDGVQAVSQPPYVGLFLSKAFLAQAGAIALIPALLRRRWLLAVGPAICIALPMARESLVVAGVCLVVWAWPRVARAGRLRMGCLWALIAAALAFDLLNPWREASAMNRVVMSHVALANLSWFGHGADSFGDTYTLFEYVHNEFIQFAYDFGLGSLLLWGAVVYALGAKLETERLVLVALLVMCGFTFPLHMPLTALAFALVTGRLAGYRYRSRNAELAGGVADIRSLEHFGTYAAGPISATHSQR